MLVYREVTSAVYIKISGKREIGKEQKILRKCLVSLMQDEQCGGGNQYINNQTYWVGGDVLGRDYGSQNCLVSEFRK